VVVALAVDLLGARQQRLDALAQLHERVAVVGLLHDAGDQLADAVAVLLEHHVALGLADALQDDLLGGLRGDAAEVVGGDVLLVDLVGVLASFSGAISTSVGSTSSPVSGSTTVFSSIVSTIICASRRSGHEHLDDAVVARSSVELDLGELRRAGLLLVGRRRGRPRARGAACPARCPSRARARSSPPGSRVTCATPPRGSIA
jgi:hypothetical protein